MSDQKLLQFAPFSSALDAGFWYQLSQKKLNEYKLEDKPIDVCGFYSNNQICGMSPIAHIDYTSFNDNLQVPPRSFPLKGLLYNTNTLEEFKNKDKKELIQSVGREIWTSMKNGDGLAAQSLLHRVLCLTFADLKKYHYYYWIAFPAFVYPKVICHKKYKFNEYFESSQAMQLLTGYDSLTVSNKMGFLVLVSEDGIISVLNLNSYDVAKNKPGKVLLGFTDPSSLESHPGWPMRNLLTLAALKWGKEKCLWDVICFREAFKDGVRSCSHSIILSVELCDVDVPEECPVTVGWEKNHNKLVPRMVNMSSSMDPSKLAESSVDLNLKLMRWRLVPELDLDVIKSTKCLLLGSGTLGCNVARCLLAWGVRNITFVDNSHVSFSNPVRQTLFEFEDCLGGGKLKAKAAADALKRIFPGVNSEGKFINIPMPGHALTENTIQTTHDIVLELEALIESHDVLFLLMDTRESRWLPTLIGTAKNKVVINAALGFDTFLVMRHGVRSKEMVNTDGNHPWQVVSGYNLGCYFCNDVVAPGNSVQDRTLDQQCTVTRPGVSFIAASLAVELMVSIIQHPLRGGAPAMSEFRNEANNCVNTVLGMIPHQIRGYLDRFQNMLHISKAFDRCIACSEKVVEKYNNEGFSFLLKAFNDPDHLSDVTGLTELLKNINVDDVLELSEDDSI